MYQFCKSININLLRRFNFDRCIRIVRIPLDPPLQAWHMSHETILDFSPLNVGPTTTLFSSSQKPNVSLYTSENKFANKSIYTGLHSISSCFKENEPRLNSPV